MIRGTTPTHTFELPFDTCNVKEVAVFYAQNDNIIIKKETEDCKLDGNVITVFLTQYETLLFDHKKNVQIQVKVRTHDDEVLASFIETVVALKCLSNEVI